LQGLFKPKNPKKYKGNHTEIVYRSSYEFKLMMELDSDPNVIEYSSEEFFINYRDPITGKARRYFPDFWIKKNVNGIIKEFIIEVKPKHQTLPPVPPKDGRSAKSYQKQVSTFLVNMAKFEAATIYSKNRNMEFQILTEDDLKIVRGTKK